MPYNFLRKSYENQVIFALLHINISAVLFTLNIGNKS